MVSSSKGHPGSKRLMMHIGSCYYHSNLRGLIDRFHCEHCQQNKISGKGYGLLPEREIRSMPFNECAVDLIGPWIVQVRGKPYEFFALTAIDTVTKRGTIFLAANIIEPQWFPDPAVISASVILFLLQGIGAL